MDMVDDPALKIYQALSAEHLQVLRPQAFSVGMIRRKKDARLKSGGALESQVSKLVLRIQLVSSGINSDLDPGVLYNLFGEKRIWVM
jgi:hypothetical protein